MGYPVFMDWTIFAVALALLIAFLFLRQRGQVPADAAVEHLQRGALVIDVRSPAEYAGGHLRRAINLPLSQIESLIAGKVKNKDQVLLLHCQSGMRSGAAKSRLNALGYKNAFNLGSYNRAARILDRA
jgi:phage shock protein E